MPQTFHFQGNDAVAPDGTLEYPAGRIDLFYRDDRHQIGSHFISEFVSSEFGVALILDEHVNRPGHVPGTLANAVNDFINASGKSDAATWNDQDEAELLNRYINRRNQTSMTDSNNRAQRIRQGVANGLASVSRGSFPA